MNFNRAFNSVNERKEDSMHFGRLIMSYRSSIDITNKVSNLVSVIASIVFNNIWSENCIYWTCECYVRSGKSNNSENMFIYEASSRCYLEPNYISIFIINLSQNYHKTPLPL